MITLYAFEFQSNVAVSLQWKKRQTFKKWQKIIASKEDKTTLLRLGAKLINEKEVSYKDVFTKKKTENKDKNAQKNKPAVKPANEKPVEEPEEETETENKDLEAKAEKSEKADTEKSDKSNLE